MRDLPPNHLRCHQDGQLVGKMTDFHHFANHWLKLSGAERWKKKLWPFGFQTGPHGTWGRSNPPRGTPLIYSLPYVHLSKGVWTDPAPKRQSLQR